jgi:Family of unknown function (DUF5367)
VKLRDSFLLLGFGIVFWIAGTIWYEMRGARVFETTGLNYGVNFVVAPVATAAVCIAILRWLRIPGSAWASASLLIAIPGMIGEAVLLSRFAQWMPGMQAASAGKYGGFLFATYALFLGIAEVVTLRARG